VSKVFSLITEIKAQVVRPTIASPSATESIINSPRGPSSKPFLR
jgi:hypothetical protein